jgi:hypothetical protein
MSDPRETRLPPKPGEPMPVTFLCPPTLVEEIDRRAEAELIGRSAWLRRAAARALAAAEPQRDIGP